MSKIEWCSEYSYENETIFNSESVIKKKIETISDIQKKNKNESTNNDIKIEKCLELDLNISKREELLLIMNYMSFVSNKLRGFIRQKNPFTNNVDYNITYDQLLEYLNWTFIACEKIKIYFILKNRKELPTDIDNLKIFKTSSYKFCNFKDSCIIHKNKSKICDKNHFVFDMVLGDLKVLIESLKIIESKEIITKEASSNNIKYNNLLWILNDNIIIFNKKTLELKKLDYFNPKNLDENLEIYIDKNIVFKCFDVISYVLNKMYEEAYLFIHFNIHSELILI
jgi:hypothetical protein